MLTGIHGIVNTEGKITARQLAFWQSLIFTLYNSKLLVAKCGTQRRDSADYPRFRFSLAMFQCRYPFTITILCTLAAADSSK